MGYKGKFKPKNIAKYKGDFSAITYRSLWELRFMRYLDSTSSIIKWSSEEIAIPYLSPLDGKRHRYFPDFWIRIKSSDGTIKERLIEIKPKIQTQPPKGGPPTDRKKRRRYIREVKTWGINEAKWKYATEWCNKNDMEFKILTEDHLNITYK